MWKIKVRFKSEDTGSCQQLFQVINPGIKARRYYARNDHGIWCTVSDPLGYAEIETTVSNDIIFIICDEKGNELFESTNGDKASLFPFDKENNRQEWKKYCEIAATNLKQENELKSFYVHAFTGALTRKLDRWLLSFKDSEQYGEKAKGYAENWTMFMIEEVSREVLHTFFYCGEEREIVKVKKRHTVCGVEWDAYFVGGDYMACSYDETNVGPMYAPAEALSKVEKALREIYGDVYRLHYVYASYGTNIEKRMSFRAAAEHLLGGDRAGNFRRTFVDEVVKKEKEKHTFFASSKEVKEVYGNNYIASY